jgi:hypothetical protein
VLVANHYREGNEGGWEKFAAPGFEKESTGMPKLLLLLVEDFRFHFLAQYIHPFRRRYQGIAVVRHL